MNVHYPSSSSPTAMGMPSIAEIARYSNGSNLSDDDAGIFMTIDKEKGTEFFAIEPPKAILTKNNSQDEKQISVDPVSLQKSPTIIRQASFRLVSPAKGLDPSPPRKLTFVSTSFSSPTTFPYPASESKKIHLIHDQQNPRINLARMQSVRNDAHLARVKANTRKSKSLGGGRTSGPVDDFEFWLEKSSQNLKSDRRTNSSSNINLIGGFSKPPLGPRSGERRDIKMKKSKSIDSNHPEDGFKCGRLCLFLPRGKGKPVRSNSSTSTVSQASSKSVPMAISKRVSLEKFECGSWPSLMKEEGDSADLFFDLPMELLRCSVSDMQSPVTAAFMFDNDDDDDYKNKRKENNIDITSKPF